MIILVRDLEYHDHFDMNEEGVEQRRRELGVLGAGGGAKKKFPIQLHRMLEAVDGSVHSLYVRWLPHGRAFAVLDKTRFENEVLPVHFPQQKEFASFQRQLNIYGFLRLTREEGYYHELLLRGRPSMASIIPRTIQGRYSSRRKYDPDSEPDFYTMRWLPDPTRPSPAALGPNASIPTMSVPPSSRMPRPEKKKAPTLSPERPESMGVARMPRSDTTDSSTARPQPFSIPSLLPNETGSPLRPSSVGLASLMYQGPLGGDSSRAANLYPLIPTNAAVSDALASAYLPSSFTVNSNPAVAGPSQFLLGNTSPVVLDANRFEERAVRLHQDPSFPQHNARSERSSSVAESKEIVGSFDTSNDDSNKPEAEEAQEEMETSSESRNGAKLSEWVEFLQDVDLDTSSGSDDKRKAN
jgi:HSF-type DNA-binding